MRSSRELLWFVRRYAGERLVCYGLNPRPAILTTPEGRLRSATDADILTSQTLLLDVDLEGRPTPERLSHLGRALPRVDAYVMSLGLRRPTRARTGRGWHLLFSYDPIAVREYPGPGG